MTNIRGVIKILEIAYYSRTGNVRDFVSWYMKDFKSFNIEEQEATGKCVLITPTYSFGEVPEEVEEWLEHNADKVVAVVSSGNKNWGNRFGRAGLKISNRLEVPLLMRFELKGSQEIADSLKEKILEIGEC